MSARFVVVRVALALLTVSASITAAIAEQLPADVVRYVERRDQCEHFRQEPWPEDSSQAALERRQFLAAQVERYCRGSDQGLRRLQKKYAKNKAVRERLQSYETEIDAAR